MCKGHFELSSDLAVIEDPRELAVMQSGIFRTARSFMFALKTYSTFYFNFFRAKRVLFLSTDNSSDRERWLNFFHKYIENFKEKKKDRTLMSQSYTGRTSNPDIVYIYGQIVLFSF